MCLLQNVNKFLTHSSFGGTKMHGYGVYCMGHGVFAKILLIFTDNYNYLDVEAYLGTPETARIRQLSLVKVVITISFPPLIRVCFFKKLFCFTSRLRESDEELSTRITII